MTTTPRNLASALLLNVLNLPASQNGLLACLLREQQLLRSLKSELPLVADLDLDLEGSADELDDLGNQLIQNGADTDADQLPLCLRLLGRNKLETLSGILETQHLLRRLLGLLPEELRADLQERLRGLDQLLNRLQLLEGESYWGLTRTPFFDSIAKPRR